MQINFYPSKTNDKLNHKWFYPETINGQVMINPRYPIKRLHRVDPWFCDLCQREHTFPRVRCDSGAFQDIGKQRYFPWTALEAQARLARRMQIYLNDESYHHEVTFTYDDPAGVDEAVINGKKMKVRGTEETAEKAVIETVKAAKYYASRREYIGGRIGFVGQGINVDQYKDCMAQMIPLMQPGDVFGFGGFCIWGRMPKQITPVAREIIPVIVDALVYNGINEFHLLGVMYPPAMKYIMDTFADRDIIFCTDSSGAELAATTSGVSYRENGTQFKAFTREQKYKEYHPCELAMKNISIYNTWLTTYGRFELA